MSIAINSNFERDQLVASFGQVLFTYSFPIFDETYLKVYQRGSADAPDDSTQLLTLGSDYSVQGVGEEEGGTITLVVPAAAGDIITIVGAEPIDRLSVFDDLNPFTRALNQQLNELTVMTQQNYTYWNHLTPRYNFDELISNEVRPFKRILPMLPNSHCWVGRGEIGEDPDDITTLFIGGIGTGNVLSSGPGMRASIARWTGTDFIITDSEANMDGAYIVPTVGTSAEVSGFGDAWGAFHWPSHSIGDRPSSPSNGDTYYDTTSQEFFGYQNGAWVPFTTGSGGFGSNSVPVTQVAHGFTPGDYVYVVEPTGVWTKTLSTIPTSSELQGLVVSAPDADNFIVLFNGYVDTATWTSVPAWFTGMTPGGVYFLSDTVLGAHSLNEPVIDGEVSLPVFWAITATTGQLRHSRGFIIGGEPSPGGGGGSTDTSKKTITQVGHGFAVEDWLYISADQTYAKGIATALNTSQTEGVVIQVIDADTFVLQQSGQIEGVVTQDDAAAPIVSATMYYLSDTVPGRLTSIAPTTLGRYTKPCYMQDDLALNSGWIQDQRPLIVSAPSGAGGDQLIMTYNVNNDVEIPFSNIFDGTYTDIKIVIRDLVMRITTEPPSFFRGTSLRMQLETGTYPAGVRRTDQMYRPMGAMAGLRFDVTFLTLNQMVDTAEGGCYEANVNINGITSTAKNKFVSVEQRYWNNSTSPTAKTWNQNSNNDTTSCNTSYIGNVFPITGFYIFADQPNLIFISGTISVYGTVA